MFFCILFNYTILRDTKDVLLLTAPKSGAEVIPFIKTYCNLPAAIVRVVNVDSNYRKATSMPASHNTSPSLSLKGFYGYLRKNV